MLQNVFFFLILEAPNKLNPEEVSKEINIGKSLDNFEELRTSETSRKF